MTESAAGLEGPAKGKNEMNLSEDAELLKQAATVAAKGAVLPPEKPANEDTAMGPDRVPEDSSTLKWKGCWDSSFASYRAHERHDQGVADFIYLKFVDLKIILLQGSASRAPALKFTKVSDDGSRRRYSTQPEPASAKPEVAKRGRGRPPASQPPPL